MTAYADFEVNAYCSRCNAPLEIDVEFAGNALVVTVDACPRCTEVARAEGNEAGASDERYKHESGE